MLNQHHALCYRVTTPTTLPVKADITEAPEEIQVQSSNDRSVMPTDIQALTVLQSLVSDDFQAKNTPSTQRKGEDTPDTRSDTHSTQRKGEDETFQLIQKIHNQLQQVQWDLQRFHSLHKYKNSFYKLQASTAIDFQFYKQELTY